MIEVGVSTATDITGFGLIGHLSEVLTASKCNAHLYSSSVPFFEDALRLAVAGIIPGGTWANAKNFEQIVSWDKDVADIEKILMNDAQTSGGLLIFVPAVKKDKLIESLQKEGVLAAYIGDLTDSKKNENVRIFVHK